MRKLLWPVIATNFLGAAYGLYYYLPQLQVTPLWLWFFVLDSPLPVFFAGVSLLLLVKGKQNALLDCLAAAWCLKWGVWSMLVIVSFPQTFLTSAVAGWYAVLFALHFLEAGEGIVFATKQKFSAATLAFVLFLSLANDYLDYFSPFQTHSSALPAGAATGWLPLATVLLSFACVGVAYLLNNGNRALFASLFDRRA